MKYLVTFTFSASIIQSYSVTQALLTQTKVNLRVYFVSVFELTLPAWRDFTKTNLEHDAGQPRRVSAAFRQVTIDRIIL